MIVPVTTVEDFWALYNHIQMPSKLPAASDYSFFQGLRSFIYKLLNKNLEQ